VGRIGESWELSVRENERSVVLNGIYRGRTLASLIEDDPSLVSKNRRFDTFPLLIKLIYASEPLSVQVHPTDAFAEEHGFESGKSERWYILDADKDAFVYIGLNCECSIEELADAVRDGRDIISMLNRQYVKRGDVISIPGGTPHAIGAGVTLAEVQENSDVTFRIFDYNRVGDDGKPRPLHRELAADALTQAAQAPNPDMPFDSFSMLVNGREETWVGEDSFLSLLITDGEGALRHGGVDYPLLAGDSYFVPADCGKIELVGNMELIVASI
jgi:mannose-6-phosphate isomerase